MPETRRAGKTRICVFGANGKVGRLVVAELLARGYQVTAVAHSPHKSDLPDDPNLQFATADVHDQEQVRAAIHDCDAVISCLGSWHTPTKDILASGMRNIIPAMQAAGISRIVSLTGAGAIAPGDTPRLIEKLNHALLKLTARKVLQDGEDHIRLLQQSDLDWTVLRSPIMTREQASNYILDDSACKPWSLIPRQAVVTALADQVEAAPSSYMNRSPYIHSSS